jgi:hypothetical protein
VSEFKIESDVPVPDERRRFKYPWSEMKVGDSFFVENGSQNVLSTAGRQYGRFHGGKFSTRKEGNGVRVWRIE